MSGVLKGYDQLSNVVLADAVEYVRDRANDLKVTKESRNLGQLVVRGIAIATIVPCDTLKEVENPWAEAA